MARNNLLRRFLRGLTALAVVLAFAGAARAGSTTITLLHVNDTHSHLDAFGPKDASLNGTLGGIAKAATIIGRERSREDNVLLLHAGDVFEGDLCWNEYFGVPEFALMEQLGFDAMAVGNHEFDGGADSLALVLSSSFSGPGVPLLSANLDLSGHPALAPFIAPSIVKTYGDVKVGILGLIVPDNASASPDLVAGFDLDEIQGQVDALRDPGGADVVVLLSHLGFRRDQEVAANVTGIDFIIGGHDHFLFKKPVVVTSPDDKTTLIFQAGSHYLDMGKLTFTVTDGAVNVDKYQMIPLDATVPPEPTIQAFVDTLKAGIVADYGQDFYGTVIANAAADIEFARPASSVDRDSGIGNLVTDAYRASTGTQIGITANGWISEKIWAGPIVGADVFHVVSYGYDETTHLGFRLVTLDLTGADLATLIEATLYQSDLDPDFSLQTSGLTFQYDSRKGPFERVLLGSLRVDGLPIDFSGSYSVTVNAGSYALVGLIGVTPTNVVGPLDLEYDVVRDYIESLGTVSYGTQGRIQDVGLRGKK